jgi:hypothetical protein
MGSTKQVTKRNIYWLEAVVWHVGWYTPAVGDPMGGVEIDASLSLLCRTINAHQFETDEAD